MHAYFVAVATLSVADHSELLRQAGDNPTYICASSDGARLYCSNEGEPSAVHAFSVDKENIDSPLTPLNEQPAGGSAACWVTLSPDERALLAVNYVSSINFTHIPAVCIEDQL